MRKNFWLLQKKVIDLGLCTKCATCAFICPMKIIQLLPGATHDLSPVCEDEDACVNCGKCVQVCPVMNPPYPTQMPRKYNFPFLLGEYQKLKIGHASDAVIRQNGASGGIVTALLISMLETGEIDGAVVMGLSEADPLQPEAKYVTSSQDIRAASSSKYVVAPLVAAMSKTEDKDIAIVGLPCHIHGIENLRHAGFIKCHALVKIGLFCGFNRSRLGFDYLLDSMIEQKDIAEFSYRCKVGKKLSGILFQTRNGERHFLPRVRWNYLDALFMPLSCALCLDYGNELSDISVGDVFKETIVSDAYNWSLLVVRTELGNRLLQKVEQREDIHTRNIESPDALKAHEGLAKHKKIGALLRRQQLEKTQDSLPLNTPLARHLLEIIIVRMAYGLDQSYFYRRLLMHTPKSVLNLFGKMIHRLNFSLPYGERNKIVAEEG